ncbi:MAG: Clp protease N-terminal domain-containing protein, partial [Ktedonobacteraceae bacterium]
VIGRKGVSMMMRDRDKYDKFTERTRKVLVLAQEEAGRMLHNFIGSEHILLGLVREGDGVGARVLQNVGVDLAEVRAAVIEQVRTGERIIQGQIGLTEDGKHVVALAVDEARRLNYHYIGTEHILLGLVREGQGIAAGVLKSLGVNLDQVRTQTLLVINQPHRQHTEHEIITVDQVQAELQTQTPLMFAGAYVRGAKQIEQSTSLIQDADDLVPAPATAAEHGNRLTLRLRRVLVRAREEAQLQEKEQVGTPHLLLALIREPNGIAFHVLKNLKIESERITSAIEFLHTQEQLSEPGTVDGFTTDGRHALELALDEARQLGQIALGTEHLLLGLLRGDGMAAGVLVTRGVNLDKVRAETRLLLGF